MIIREPVVIWPPCENSATAHGVVLIFDGVKTGYRHAFGDYQALCGVTSDLSTFGKAVANAMHWG